MAFIPTPRANVYAKASTGTSDVSIENNVYKFMGCSVLSVNTTIGFNGSASSLNITLVEDRESGDSFTTPTMPSVWAFSLPKGGVGQPIFVENSFNFNPNAFDPTNVPFYFTGICTGFSKAERDVSGKLITVDLVDPRDILKGVQCLMGGFALSQNLTGSIPRYSQVENIIDVFGYYDYGMTADKNEYGMTWEDIMTAIEAVQVEVNNIKFEFLFTGECFDSAPEWYRLDDSIIDIVSLAEKVANDGGSDVICIGRKVSTDTVVVEFRGIRRTNTDVLTESEIEDFVSDRSSIVSNYKSGREYRNEPTSSVIIGGMRNSNYTAYPSQYEPDMHVRLNNFPGGDGELVEDYNAFPSDIKVRLFGGSHTVYQETANGSGLGAVTENFNIDAGAIFPFWGFSPSGTQYPLIEPFLSLDHLVFDKDDIEAANLKTRIPLCRVAISSFTVREVPHLRVFLENDEDSDTRPFAYVADVVSGDETSGVEGYIRGLPLNTEILRAALADRTMFFNLFSMYYPEFAEDLKFPSIDFRALLLSVNSSYTSGASIRPYANLTFTYKTSAAQQKLLEQIARDPFGFMAKADFAAIADEGYEQSVLLAFHNQIYDKVREYAEENMGRQFLVCLPRSEIMNRIWSGLPVPTRPDYPEIEYVIADRGYWEVLPFELDGIVGASGTGTFTGEEEEQIRRRFMAEDGRFYPMAGIDWKPSGNCSFNSNQLNKAMFQDLPVSDFRPNKIAQGNPTYILCGIEVDQLKKRPDLALIRLPNTIYFDPQLNSYFSHGFVPNSGPDDFTETLYAKMGLMKYLWYHFKRDINFRSAMLNIATKNGDPNNMYRVASEFIDYAAEYLKNTSTDVMKYDGGLEPVMDLKGAIIPLTSTWVSYGPWYATSGVSRGMVDVRIDESLVPWNFERPYVGNWDDNLNTAGNEALDRTISNTDYVDNAVVSAAGFPEFGLGEAFGKNSNLTSISVNFGTAGISTDYIFATYNRKPGTYRKSEYDNVSRARYETRPDIKLPENKNISQELYAPTLRNRFRG